jgi:spore maturation protein CgeB
MNIIYVNWDCFGGEDLVQALDALGHHIYITQMSEKCHISYDEEFANKLTEIIKAEHTDVVVTFNYFPTISMVCEKLHCRYLAWMYDNPSIKVYDKSITNECNYIAAFDSALVNELQAKGVETVHYMPLAVNTKRMRALEITSQDKERFSNEISFVGSLYNEEHNFYDRLVAATQDKELQGYIDGLIEAQRKVYGYNFIAECLDEKTLGKIREALPFRIGEDTYLEERQVYADYYLARRLAYLERVELLTLLSHYFEVAYYTHNQNSQIGKARNCGQIHYFNDMPKVFRLSKVNINPTLRSIKNGIPLRAMDILGAGGFLVTNYQEDFMRHFEPEVHFTYYTSREEALDKVNYYLHHEEERINIVKNASELIYKEHSYEVRCMELLKDMKIS